MVGSCRHACADEALRSFCLSRGSEGFPRTGLFQLWARWGMGPVAGNIFVPLLRDRGLWGGAGPLRSETFWGHRRSRHCLDHSGDTCGADGFYAISGDTGGVATFQTIWEHRWGCYFLSIWGRYLLTILRTRAGPLLFELFLGRRWGRYFLDHSGDTDGAATF